MEFAARLNEGWMWELKAEALAVAMSERLGRVITAKAVSKARERLRKTPKIDLESPVTPSVALSIRQPWAWLIATGQKDIENRTWPTKRRGRFLVHAGQRVPTEAELADIERTYRVKVDRAALQYGGIVGSASLADCVTSHPSKWFEPGGCGFVLSDASPLPFRPLKGKLGFFSAP